MGSSRSSRTWNALCAPTSSQVECLLGCAGTGTDQRTCLLFETGHGVRWCSSAMEKMNFLPVENTATWCRNHGRSGVDAATRHVGQPGRAVVRASAASQHVNFVVFLPSEVRLSHLSFIDVL